MKIKLFVLVLFMAVIITSCGDKLTDIKDIESLIPDGLNITVEVSVSGANGMTQNDLKSPANLRELQDIYERYYPVMFEDFESFGDMRGKELGKNYFAVYKFIFEGVFNYEATTVIEDDIYCIIFKSPDGHGEDIENEFEKILESLKF